MKRIILALFVVLLAGSVVSYDADNPYTVTLKWIVPSDTSFAVALCGAETTIDFEDNIPSSTLNGAEPDCQNASLNHPMLTVTNNGNLPLNFTNNLTAAKPSWATLKVSNSTTYAESVSFDTTPVNIGKNIAAGNNLTIYLWTDLNNATAGTTQRTYEVDGSG